jgi:diguanylate cyclase (GGDEF)-like protein
VTRPTLGEPELFCIDVDLSDQKEHEQALALLANYDALTGLPNRRLLGDLIEQMTIRTRRSGSGFALCYLDLDGFKPINDGHGHGIGDEVLVATAERLRRLVRGSDLVARLGGDEFVIALDGIGNGPELDRRLNAVLEGVARPVLIDRLELQVSASIGVTLFPKDSADPDTLLRHADQAMYRAKSQGRNRYSLFDVELEEAVEQRRGRLLEIERGLDAGQFRLHYQPKIDLRSGRVSGLEGLIRWHHPERGLLSPMEFLPALDRTDLEFRFGNEVMRQALEQLQTWATGGLATSVSVNISAHHLLGDGFVETVAELLKRFPPAGGGRLALEIVETAAVSDLQRAVTVLNELREFGVEISLDDFGTGYSSLSHLRSLPVDEVKVDQTFVRDMLVDQSDYNIVQGVVGLSRAFGLRVIAEGVETEAHLDALRELGCAYAQGYLFAAPMPADKVKSWLGSGPSSGRPAVPARAEGAGRPRR